MADKIFRVTGPYSRPLRPKMEVLYRTAPGGERSQSPAIYFTTNHCVQTWRYRLYRYACDDVYVLQVYAQGAMPGNAGPNDIESNQSTWGVGANITTKLINQTGEVREYWRRP